MKNNKITYISFGIIIVAFVMYVMTLKKDNSPKEFVKFIDENKLSQFKIISKDKTFDMKKVLAEKRWAMKDSFGIDMTVDVKKIDTAITFLTEAMIVQKVTKKEDLYKEYDLTEELSKKLELTYEDGKIVKYYIGKEKDNSMTFARRPDDPYVYLLSKNFFVETEPEGYFYKRILPYELDAIDNIEYFTKDKKTVKIFFDKTKGDFNIKEVPQGKQVKDFIWTKDGFKELEATKFIVKDGKLKLTNIVTHKVNMIDGAQIKMDFVKTTEKNNEKNYVSIVVDEKKSTDPKIKHLKAISDKYIFELSYFNTNQFAKNYAELFEDKPKEEKKEKIDTQQKGNR